MNRADDGEPPLPRFPNEGPVGSPQRGRPGQSLGRKAQVEVRGSSAAAGRRPGIGSPLLGTGWHRTDALPRPVRPRGGRFAPAGKRSGDAPDPSAALSGRVPLSSTLFRGLPLPRPPPAQIHHPFGMQPATPGSDPVSLRDAVGHRRFGFRPSGCSPDFLSQSHGGPEKRRGRFP